MNKMLVMKNLGNLQYYLGQQYECGEDGTFFCTLETLYRQEVTAVQLIRLSNLTSSCRSWILEAIFSGWKDEKSRNIQKSHWIIVVSCDKFETRHSHRYIYIDKKSLWSWTGRLDRSQKNIPILKVHKWSETQTWWSKWSSQPEAF